jgi:hypothetical protein
VGALRARVEVRAAFRAGRVESDLLGITPLLAAGLAREDDGLVLVGAATARSALAPPGSVGPGPARPDFVRRILISAMPVFPIVHSS